MQVSGGGSQTRDKHEKGRKWVCVAEERREEQAMKSPGISVLLSAMACACARERVC